MEIINKISNSPSQTFSWLISSFILGVALASFFDLRRSVFFYVYLALLILALALYIFWKNKEFRLMILGGIFLVAGILRFLSSEPAFKSNQTIFYHDRLVKISGFVSAEPSLAEKQSIIIQIEKLKVANSNIPERKVAGKAIAYVPLYPRYNYGDKLEVECLLSAPLAKDNQNYIDRLARQGVWSVCVSPEINKVGESGGSFFGLQILKLNHLLTGQVNKILNEPQASFLNGLLYGARQSIPEDLKNAFNRTGTTHIIAISGYNITIIATALLIFLRSLLIPRKKAFWLAVLAIVFFVFLTGASASVVRAGIMGIIALLARQLGRQSQVSRLLLITAFLMLLVNPRILFFDAGFQLSFVATLGLVYVSPLLEKYFASWPNPLGIKEVILTTLSAIIATTPLILFLFGRLSIVAPIANLLILPIIPYTMALGFGALVLSFIFFPVGQALGWVTWILLTYIIKVIYSLAAWPWASISLPVFPWWLMGIIYGIMIIWVYRKTLCLKNS